MKRVNCREEDWAQREWAQGESEAVVHRHTTVLDRCSSTGAPRPVLLPDRPSVVVVGGYHNPYWSRPYNTRAAWARPYWDRPWHARRHPWKPLPPRPWWAVPPPLRLRSGGAIPYTTGGVPPHERWSLVLLDAARCQLAVQFPPAVTAPPAATSPVASPVTSPATSRTASPAAKYAASPSTSASASPTKMLPPSARAKSRSPSPPPPPCTAHTVHLGAVSMELAMWDAALSDGFESALPPQLAHSFGEVRHAPPPLSSPLPAARTHPFTPTHSRTRLTRAGGRGGGPLLAGRPREPR